MYNAFTKYIAEEDLLQMQNDSLNTNDKTVVGAINELNNNLANTSNGGVGKSTTGTVYTIDDTEVTAKEGAEIFNNYSNNIASGLYSHAEGCRTTASGDWSHAEGYGSVASWDHSHAEGHATTASGYGSHAEGQQTTASGSRSHAEGAWTIASGDFSHAEGRDTIASGKNQHVQGIYNIEDTENKYAHIVGNGGHNKDRSNAHTLDWEGNAWYQGNVYVGGTSQDDASQLATTTFVEEKVSSLVDSAPDTLNTLNELATAITSHQSVTDALDSAITNKQDKTDETLTTTDKTIAGAINEINEKASAQSDWNECDPNSPAYIKNKIARSDFLMPNNTVEIVGYEANTPYMLVDFGTQNFKSALAADNICAKSGENSSWIGGYSINCKSNTDGSEFNWTPSVINESYYINMIDNNNYTYSDNWYVIVDKTKLTTEYSSKFTSNGIWYMSSESSDTGRVGARIYIRYSIPGAYIHQELVASRKLVGLKTENKTVIGAINELNNSSVGKSTTGTVYTINDEEVTAVEGAEIFNDYAYNIAIGAHSHSEGNSTKAIGPQSHAEGAGTTASGAQSHAEGSGTTASGESSHAEGYNTTAEGIYSHAEGNGAKAIGETSHAEGFDTTASGMYSHAEGSMNTASGADSHAEGSMNTASGDASHAEGYSTTASEVFSHAEGSYTTASKPNSHAEGDGSKAEGKASHAEGIRTTASGDGSHAEGISTVASGDYSHAEGSNTEASGFASHAEGECAIASVDYSHAEGFETKSSSFCQHVQGAYNIEDTNNTYLHIVGNGANDTDRSNAHTLDWDGNAWFAGDVYVGGTAQTNSKKLSTKEYVDTKVADVLKNSGLIGSEGLVITDLSAYESTWGFITNTGLWSNINEKYQFIVIPITNIGSVLTITANTSTASYLAGLRSYSTPVSGAAVDFSTVEGWTARFAIPKNSTKNYNIPDDVKYLIVFTVYNTANSIPNSFQLTIPEAKGRLNILEEKVDDLENKTSLKWLALGDSITEGYYSIMEDGTEDTESHKSVDECYCAWIAKMKGFELDNQGVGGSGWLKRGTAAAPKLNAREQIDATNEDGSYVFDFTKYDLCTIMWGVNDWKGSQNFGTFEDGINPATESVIGNMRYVIETILTRNPAIKLILITPVNCCQDTSGRPSSADNNWGIGFTFGSGDNAKTLQDYYDAIKQVCEYYGIEMIDMLHTSVINRITARTMLPDKVHPSLEAHKQIGLELAGRILYGN